MQVGGKAEHYAGSEGRCQMKEGGKYFNEKITS